MVTRSCFSSRLQTSLFDPSLYLNRRPHDREASTLPLCYSTIPHQFHNPMTGRTSILLHCPFLTDIKKGSYHQQQSSCVRHYELVSRVKHVPGGMIGTVVLLDQRQGVLDCVGCWREMMVVVLWRRHTEEVLSLRSHNVSSNRSCTMENSRCNPRYHKEPCIYARTYTVVRRMEQVLQPPASLSHG